MLGVNNLPSAVKIALNGNFPDSAKRELRASITCQLDWAPVLGVPSINEKLSVEVPTNEVGDDFWLVIKAGVVEHCPLAIVD
jgi:hypothetical protein